MAFEKFDRSQLRLLPLPEREHDVSIAVMLDPDEKPVFSHPTIDVLAQRIRAAKEKGAAVVVMLGAHVIRSGCAPILIRLMEEGYVTHYALNGAGAIHDFELAMIGNTCESVAKYISEGQFGLWEDDNEINLAVNNGYRDGIGFGEAIGRHLEENHFLYRDTSLFAAGYRLRVPVTAHVGIGNDIVHELPSADGAAIGATSYDDFLIYARSIQNLEGGVFLNIGSAVTGPEVYLKALSMARNVAHQKGEKITDFTTAVFDLMDLEDEDTGTELPKSDPRYYFRPWKTILARTVADGGESYYLQGKHAETVPALGYALLHGE